MKYLILILSFLLSIQFTHAQNLCGTDINLESQIKNNPSLKRWVLQNLKKSDITQNTTKKNGRSQYIIPVVFHVFHNHGLGNISDAQILNALEIVNKNYSRTNSDTALIRPIFKPFSANTDIEFRLAQIDPNGNCTNGINRINNPALASQAYNNVKLASQWPSDSYLNIWVVNKIKLPNQSGSPGGLATFPGVGDWGLYGLLIQHDNVGNIGTGKGNNALTHELGHCLNLLHTFSQGCGNFCETSGDRICDTPPESSGLVTCDPTENQCSNDSVGISPFNSDMPNQIENFMSYSTCTHMFTHDQKTRMHNTLTNFTNLAQLVSPQNLIATGVTNPTSVICAANFTTSLSHNCTNNPVQFYDESYHHPVSHYWEFEGGLPSTSTEKNPIISYAKQGNYNVKLTVTDTNGSMVSQTKNNFVTILSSVGKTAPFMEDFEQHDSLNQHFWHSRNWNSNTGWRIDTQNGFSGDNSLVAVTLGDQEIHEVISSLFDASNLKSGTFSIRLAHAPSTNETNTFLRVYFSNDCNENWTQVQLYGGNLLNTANTINTTYTTPNPSDWENKDINIPIAFLTKNLRVKFEYNVNNGNNLFIDDIQINGILSSKIQLRSPINGAQYVESNPTLNWNATSPIDHYHLEIDTDSNLTSANYESHILNYISDNSNHEDTEWYLTNLVHEQTYYWKVSCSLNGVDTSISEIWKFKVDSNIVGIQKPSTNSFDVLIFPNPSTNQFHIKVNQSTNNIMHIAMYDITGTLVRTIHSGMLSNKETTFTISRDGLSNGIYLIQTRSSENFNSKKIVLE